MINYLIIILWGVILFYKKNSRIYTGCGVSQRPILEAKKEDIEIMVSNNAFILEEMKEKAKEEGREKGREEGRQQVKLDIAKNMKILGLEVDTIMKITGLSKEEILKIDI